jgi:hypothetical protein
LEFEDVLKECDITIKSGSDLERICLNILCTLGEKQQPHLVNPLEDIRPYFSDLLGLWIFLTKIINLRTHRDFGKLVPHLQLLNEGNVPQNKESTVGTLPVREEACNKIFELLIAFLCLEVGQDLWLASPTALKGDNPDVIVTIDGLRWGFACKVPHGKPAKSIYDNINKGVDQIEASPAEIGCVVLNFRNLIDHNRSWPIMNETEVSMGKAPIFGGWCNHMFLAQELALFAQRKKEEIEMVIGKEEVIKTFNGKKAIPAALIFLHTATGIATRFGPLPTSIKMFYLCRFDYDYFPMFEKLNQALHKPYKTSAGSDGIAFMR